MVFAKVRDKRTGLERTTTPKAYSIIPNRYDLLGYEDEEGNPVDGPEVKTVQKKRSPESVGSVARPVITQEERDAKRAELNAMNQEAMDRAKKNAENKKAMEELGKSGGKLPMNHSAVIAHNQRKQQLKESKNAEV